MAVSTGNKALYTDLVNWYTVFNSLASNYSDTISTISTPAAGSKISASNLNNLHAKITEF